jgi:predicted MFS family arabinose efflux permease
VGARSALRSPALGQCSPWSHSGVTGFGGSVKHNEHARQGRREAPPVLTSLLFLAAVAVVIWTGSPWVAFVAVLMAVFWGALLLSRHRRSH